MATPPTLVRSIALPQAVALYVGAVLGAGVLVLPGVVASQAGPASLLSWAAVGLLGLPLALTFAALARRMPDAGGVSTYARRAFGPTTGSTIGWLYFTAGSVGQAIVPLTGAYYVTAAFGWSPWSAFAVAAGILLAALVANLGGLQVSGRIQLGLSAGVAVVLLAAILAALPRVEGDAFEPFAPQGLGEAARAMVPLFFAFAGWEAITHLSSEFRRPERDIVRATSITVAIVLVLYVGLAVAVVGTGTYGTPEVNRVAVARLLGDGIGVGAEVIAALAALVISLGTTNAFVAATSRLGYALGRDEAFPEALGRLDPAGVPRNSILAVGAVAAMALAATAAAGWGAEDLVFLPSALVIAVYVVGMAAGVRLLDGAARALALVGCLACLAVVPFIGASALVPVVLAAAAAVYRRRWPPSGGSGSPTQYATVMRRPTARGSSSSSTMAAA